VNFRWGIHGIALYVGTICGANGAQGQTGKHGTSPEMGGVITKPDAI